MILGNQANVVLGPIWWNNNTSIAGDSTGRVDSSTEKIGIQFLATTTDAITAVDQLVDFVGNTSGVTWQLGVYNNVSNSPGTLLTGASVTFAGPAASALQWAGGGTNPLTLGSSTGTLVLNTLYWLVLEVSAGTPDASNYAQIARFAANIWGGEGCTFKLYTASAWGSAVTTRTPVYMLKHGTTGYLGIPTTVGLAVANNPATDIYGNNRQGIKARFGSKVVIAGIAYRLTKTATPADLVVAIFEGSTLIGTSQLDDVTIYSGTPIVCALTSPITVNNDVDVYIVLRQKGSTADDDNGGTDAADYDLQVATIVSGYWESMLPSTWSYVYGIGNDPTAYTSTQTVFAPLLPIIMDADTQLDVPVGSGGGIAGVQIL